MTAKQSVKQNEEVEQLKFRLESVTEELEAFAYSISHDLRAPARHIHSFAKLIETHSAKQLDDKSILYLQNILTSAERMSQLIDDLLAYSRVGKSEVRQLWFKLADLINEIIQEDLLLESRNRKIQSDPTLLRQVFTNLISNALKFTRPIDKPKISIGRIDEAGRTIIFVRDNGIGFNNKYNDRLFDVFYRLHQQDRFEGSGIGLAIVKRIMTRYCGEAWAEGKENEGATFFLGFPDETMTKKV